MAPRTASAMAAGIFNLTTLLRSLPSATSQVTPQALTKCIACSFSTTVQVSSNKRRKPRKNQDPYRAAQAKQRRVANIARQSALRSEREAALGDPVRSSSTQFLESLRGSTQTATSTTSQSSTSQESLNFFLQPSDLRNQIMQSKWLAEPVPLSEIDPNNNLAKDPNYQKERLSQWEKQHANAETAIERITALSAGSSRDHKRANLQRCIEEFGRHNTDKLLPPKPASSGSFSNGVASKSVLSESEALAEAELAAIPKRVGKDTGSSEVQVAMLTVKIGALVENLHKKDKTNKRNLRLLVHRRQKLLRYLRRRERGGPRWQHLVEKLGITDAMWKGEISL